MKSIIRTALFCTLALLSFSVAAQDLTSTSSPASAIPAAQMTASVVQDSSVVPAIALVPASAAQDLTPTSASASAAQERQSRRRETIELGGELRRRDTTKERRLTVRLIQPKGEWQCGIAVMYADLNTDNSEYMLIAQNVSANGFVLRLAPEAAYTFMDNHAIGARFQYTTARGAVDSVTADLLGNYSTTFQDVHANTRSMGGCIFERTYVGLDKRGRVGVFWDYTLGYTRTRSQFYTGEKTDAYSISKRVSLNFAPGLIYYPMNNLSIQACVGLLGVSYNNTSAYQDGELSGSRNRWQFKCGFNLLDISLGLAIHL